LLDQALVACSSMASDTVSGWMMPPWHSFLDIQDYQSNHMRSR
jgi:hypothetical protein